MSQQTPEHARLAEATAVARRKFEGILRAAREQRAYADGQLARFEAERAKLAAFKDQPAKPEHNTYMSAELLIEAYTAMARMQGLVIEVHTANLQVLAVHGTPHADALRVPERLLGFVEQQRRFDLAMARYLVRFNAAGIDAILRAEGHEGPITPVDAKHKAAREAEIAAVKGAAQRSQALAQLLGKLAPDLAEARRIIRWGIDAFKRFGTLAPAQKLELLRHPDWARLAALLPLLRELHERCSAFEALRGRVLPWNPDRPAWAEAEQKAAAREEAARPQPAAAANMAIAGGNGRASALKLA